MTHNYHLVSLKMLANIYQTGEGLSFVSESHIGSQIIEFCEYSLQSASPKTRYTAGVVVFNHMLTLKEDQKGLSGSLLSFLRAVTENIDRLAEDTESMLAIILAETRILYKNPSIQEKIGGIKDKIIAAHKSLQQKTSDQTVKEAVGDLLLLL